MTPLPDQGPLVAWYGDDFTGAASVMEVLEFAGFASVLFIGLPDQALMSRFSHCRCIGFAGDARTRPPEWMDAHLPAIYSALRATGAPLVHYKLCSTFDSAPGTGSIGRAAELGIGDWAPLVTAAPRIGRWQVFGNLFARHPGGIARLDRHPTMSAHPVTPMDESDLARHLAYQTELPAGLVTILDLQSGQGAAALKRERARGARIVSFDLMDSASLIEAGGVIWDEAMKAQLFALGSQGLEDALIAAWHAAGHRAPPPRQVAGTGRIAVLSGSCSPDTARQIEAAAEAGFELIHIDAALTIDASRWNEECARVERLARASLDRGVSPLIHSALGPDDPAIAAARAAQHAACQSARDAAEALGRGFGRILGGLYRSGLSRAVIAGGDTSSYATAKLGAVAVTAVAEIAPAVPLLNVHFADPAKPPFELVVKGGQMGPENLFGLIRHGKEAASTGHA